MNDADQAGKQTSLPCQLEGDTGEDFKTGK